MTVDKKNFCPATYTGVKKEGKEENGGFDLSKHWFVFVTQRTPTGNQRKKYYGDINKYHTIEERLRECDKIIAELKQIASQSDHRYERHALYLEMKKIAVNQRKKGAQSYESKLRIFLKWINYLPAKDIKESHADKFIAHLFAQNKSATTVNGYKQLLKMLFCKLRVKKNPFADIKKFKESRESLLHFDRESILKIKNHIHEKDPQNWLAVQFIYYCFIRPGELRQLKWENVNFSSGKVYIPASIAKNRKSDHVVLPDVFYKFLMQNGYSNEPKSNYIIGKNNNTQILGRDAISKKHRKYLDELGFGSKYSLYSWKYTGIAVLFQSNLNSKAIQTQLRHSDLEMVNAYAKHLGLDDFTQIRTKFPEISTYQNERASAIMEDLNFQGVSI